MSITILICLKFKAQNKPRVSDLSIGKHAPMPRYIVRKVPNKKTDIAIGLLNGFENLLTFSIKGRIIKPSGINV